MKEMWNERFSKSGYFYGTQPNVFLAANLPKLKPQGQVLSIGEGEGRNAVFLAQQGFRVSAVDYAESGRDKALALAREKNVTLDYQIADLSQFDFGVEQWDAVISVFCHLPQSIRASVHGKILQSLKPGGMFLLESYNPRQLEFGTGGPKDVTMLYTPSMLREDFKGAHWTELNELTTVLHEGAGHEGMSSVLRGFAKKI